MAPGQKDRAMLRNLKCVIKLWKEESCKAF